MRFITAAASSALLSVLALGVTTPALAQEAEPAAVEVPAATGDATDAELAQFAAAMAKVRAVAAAVQNGAPTAEQQAEMAGAIENSGLTVERFNAISAAVSADEVLQARVAVAGATASAAGSVGAGVTDAETGQFAKAMGTITGIAQALNGAAPDADQQAAMAEAITASGLTIERFNEISGASGSDAHLRARIALAAARAA